MEDQLQNQTSVKEVSEVIYTEDHNAQHSGIHLLEVQYGFARVSMSVESHTVNIHVICLGGMIFTHADTSFSYTSNSYNQVSVAQHCSINFIQPAKKGDLLTAKVWEQLLEGRKRIYDVEVTNQIGK